jgi:hypothetical protein
MGSPDADLAVAVEDTLHHIGGYKLVTPGSNGAHDLVGPRDVSLVDELLVLGEKKDDEGFAIRGW